MLLLRADRIELSKNIVRGFQAYAALLRAHPEWRRAVTFFACLYPSREEVAEYRDYARACEQAAHAVNDEFGEPGWEPVRLSVEDDVHRVLAAYGRYDVLLVNPVVDGLNLVAKEGPTLNRRDGVLILSRAAGAFEELGPYAVPVNPFDVRETANALHAALSMDGEERASRARALRRRLGAGTPARWIARQLRDLESARPARSG
jgi:trehalose 6-phosphate synthase